MRYREGVTPSPDEPYGESMHAMLSLSAWIGIVFGVVMFLAARRGRSVWLTWWSAALVLCALGYLAADALGWWIARV